MTELDTHLAEQDTHFARAFALIAAACERSNPDRAFPGAALAVTYRGALVAHKAFGRFTYDSGSPPIAPDTVFDLASVTKVVATTAMAMLLCQRHQLELDAPLCEALSEFDDPRSGTKNAARRAVTLNMLLAHSSGLPAYLRLYQKARSREEMIRLAATTPLEAPPGTRAAYSDIGFILLGEALERIVHEPLDHFCGARSSSLSG